MLKIAEANPDQFCAIDVRQWLQRDPVQGKLWDVAHDKDSDFLPCQLSLLNSPGFVDCVQACAADMASRWSEKLVWVLYCTAGQHRSDGAAKAIDSRVFNIGPDESRFFNCNVFSLSCANVRSFETTVVHEAVKWLQSPWCLRRGGGWGDKAADASSIAWANLRQVDKIGVAVHVDAWLDHPESAPVDRLAPVAGAAAEARVEETAEELVQETAEEPDEETAPVAGAQPLEPTDVPAPIDEPAAPRQRPGDWVKRLLASEQVSGSSGSVQEPAEKRPRVDASAGPATPPMGDPCPLCEGTGVYPALKEIDCIEAWSAILEKFGVDDNARWDWCALYSTTNPKGKDEALSIVHKILKKDSGGYGVDKPSAFVVSTVRNAWRSIRDFGDRDHGDYRHRHR